MKVCVTRTNELKKNETSHNLTYRRRYVFMSEDMAILRAVMLLGSTIKGLKAEVNINTTTNKIQTTRNIQ